MHATFIGSYRDGGTPLMTDTPTTDAPAATGSTGSTNGDASTAAGQSDPKAGRNSAPDPAQTDQSNTDADQSSDSTDQPLGEGGKKALEAERKARKAAEQAAGELRHRLQAVEDAKLSDLERAQKSAKEAEEKAAKADAQLNRLRIAARHGLSEEEAEDLPDDPEKAERLAQRLGSNKSVTPRPDPTQGGTGSVPAKSTDEQFADFANTFFSR